MDKNIKAIIIIVAIIVGIIIFINWNNKNTRKNNIDEVYQKWLKLAQKGNKTLDEVVVKSELSKLTDEDLAWLSQFTDKVANAKTTLDYLALASDMKKLHDIMSKTSISAIIDGIVFSNLISKTSKEQ